MVNIKHIIKQFLPYGFVNNLHRKNLSSDAFKLQFEEFQKLIHDDRFQFSWKDIYPCLYDNTKQTDYDPHYLYHPAWAIRKLIEIAPEKHVDISSSVYFNAFASALYQIEFYDYRPANITLNNLKCLKNDVTQLTFEDNSIQSLSCMHVIEHIGLGRYGDPINPIGDIVAINELKRVLNLNGHLLFVVPISHKAKIQFNAHRIYTFDLIIELFDGLNLQEFSFVNDNGKFIENATLKDIANQNYGCGCFHFKKLF